MILILSQISVLGWTAFQDFKSREISWFLIPLLFGLGLASAVTESVDWIEYGFSALFVTAQLIMAYLYFCTKQRSIRIQFTDTLLGLGDILFFYAMVPFFNFEDFVFHHIAGFIFSIVCHLIYHQIKPQSSIPLAGWLSIYYSSILIYKVVI